MGAQEAAKRAVGPREGQHGQHCQKPHVLSMVGEGAQKTPPEGRKKEELQTPCVFCLIELRMERGFSKERQQPEGEGYESRQVMGWWRAIKNGHQHQA